MNEGVRVFLTGNSHQRRLTYRSMVRRFGKDNVVRSHGNMESTYRGTRLRVYKEGPKDG